MSHVIGKGRYARENYPDPALTQNQSAVFTSSGSAPIPPDATALTYYLRAGGGGAGSGRRGAAGSGRSGGGGGASSGMTIGMILASELRALGTTVTVT
jgi:hypothetical protein